jgi:hydroxyacylglutathione hydrolase
MALLFERIQTEGVDALSYLIGDDGEGVAAVFDPSADIDCYLQIACEKQVEITHIFETHIHVDFVSGARELCARATSAKIFLSHEGEAQYDFDHEAIKDGDIFTFGSVLVTVRHTPGHTPEHVAYLLSEKNHPDAPWGVLTGDSFCVGSAGHPGHLVNGQGRKLVEQQFNTLRNFYLKLNDNVIVYPAHGNCTLCGEVFSQRLSSTIGYEWRFNSFFQFYDVTSFTDYVLSSIFPTRQVGSNISGTRSWLHNASNKSLRNLYPQANWNEPGCKSVSSGRNR